MSERTAPVVLLGDLMVDIIVVPTAPIAPTSDTPSHVNVARGGAAGNLACAIARAGQPVTFCAMGSDDWATALIRDDFASFGVTTQLRVVDAPTGIVVAIVDHTGQRAMLTDKGANAKLTPSDIDAMLDLEAKHFHLSGYTLLEPTTRPAGRYAMAKATERGWPLSVDVCSVGPLHAIGPAHFLESAAGADLLFANHEEALVLTGATSLDRAIDRLCDDFAEVVVTLGSQGAVAAVGTQRFEAPSVATTVVDTTGAGDAATGTYLARRLDGRDPEASLHAAMEAAATVVSGLGASGQLRL